MKVVVAFWYMNTFSVGSCVRFGWETFKKRAWFFIGATIVYILLSWAISFVAHLITGGEQGNALATLISFPFSVLLTMGLTALMLKAHDNVDSVKIADLWHPHNYWNFFLAYLIVFVSTIIGLILLVVPGIIVAIALGFYSYIIIERSMGPIEALKESMRITKGHRWDLFVLMLACFGIAILGLVCLLVGIFVALPVIMLAMVHAYRTLAKIAETTPSTIV